MVQRQGGQNKSGSPLMFVVVVVDARKPRRATARERGHRKRTRRLRRRAAGAAFSGMLGKRYLMTFQNFLMTHL